MLSIITPVFNGKRFIEFCIKNVIEQNCPDAEHIIVDGGSTDGTVEIIKRYAEKYPHIRWVSEKDRGQSDAMNKGIAMARGEILGFLNADDYYEPKVFDRIIEIFKTLPEPSLLVGNCNVWGDDGTIKWINKPANLKFTDLLIGNESKNPFPVNPSAYYYHKSLHNKIGLYDITDHFTMDLDFLLRAIRGAASVLYVDEAFGNFRYIVGTKTHNDFKNGESYLRFNALLRKYRKKLPLSQNIKIGFLHAIYKSQLAIKDSYYIVVSAIQRVFNRKAYLNH
ncbi:MAG: glycosyltransferase [Nitrospirae bacterium]|nr:glycosyltransferase [Nitrospirota bacterium]